MCQRIFVIQKEMECGSFSMKIENSGRRDNQFFNDGRGKWGKVFYDPIKGNPKYGSLEICFLGSSHVFMFILRPCEQQNLHT